MTLWQAVDELAQMRLGERYESWWRASTQGPVDRVKLLAALSGAGRRFGIELVAAPLERAQALEGRGLSISGRPWAELGRVGLLLAAAQRLPSDEVPAFVEEAYRTGDLAEKQAVLRALPHLPAPGRLVAIAAEGARANALSIFTAIASDNGYPAAHFPDERWNQMVMKALFNDVPLSTVTGLAGRMNPDLQRMARDYGKERRAAGRPISADLSMLEGEGESR